MNYYEDFIRERLAVGDDPNDITQRIEEALGAVATDWALFGDGRWRTETVCSVCGSWAAGICAHAQSPEQSVILRSDYEKTQGARA